MFLVVIICLFFKPKTENSICINPVVENRWKIVTWQTLTEPNIIYTGGTIMTKIA